MSGAAGGDDVETLAKVVRGAQDTTTSTEDGLIALAVVRSSWLADRLRAERAEGAREALEKARRERPRAPMPVCTDPECTIPRKPGFPMHGPHDFRARAAAHATQETGGEGAKVAEPREVAAESDARASVDPNATAVIRGRENGDSA